MTNVQSFFYLVILGLILYIAGRHFEDYTSGILGGLLICTMGLAILLSPLTGMSDLMNAATGTILLGFGGYVWVAGSIEKIFGYERTKSI